MSNFIEEREKLYRETFGGKDFASLLDRDLLMMKFLVDSLELQKQKIVEEIMKITEMAQRGSSIRMELLRLEEIIKSL